ncbi:ABC transporter permease [Paenibacillus sp. MBLB2552]|uniref:ABC transporter permease n=1 Tax=Paenibacillus mellifer TaxID=2937794 RepID=A0A9X1XUW3_9BACL|nr:ABC transporter permease [Paenibacillus mellifer]MCK8485787.1 ABC transporter permease [Paenibacillus mellifer]
MWTYLIRRGIHSLIVLFIVMSVCFCIMRLMPGNFWSLSIGMTEEQIQRANEQKHLFGLDRPIYQQYIRWVNDLLHGNFGLDYYRTPINNYIWKYVWNSFALLGTSLIIALLIAVPWGIYNSKRQDGLSDKLGLILSLIGFSIPVFVLGHWLQNIFAFQLFWFPPSSMHTPNKTGEMGDLIYHMVLPVTTVTIGLIAYYMKMVRTSMIEVLPSEFLNVARAKGVSERRVTYRHALRAALLPIITIIMLDLPSLISGAAVVENVFNWNGLGSLAVSSAQSRNYPVLLMSILIISAFVVVTNFLADLLYTIVDPRVKIHRKGILRR